MNSFNPTQSATPDEVQQPSDGPAAIPQSPAAVGVDASPAAPPPETTGSASAPEHADEDEALEPGALSPVQKEARCYCW
jgi:hypothetical protein